MSDPSAPRPVSERKLAALRANAQKSTGPRTPEGKARSSRNALKHGLRATPLTLLAAASDQERELLDDLLAEIEARVHPDHPFERLLVERLAIAHLRQLRVYAIERAALIRREAYAGPSGVTSLPGELAELLQYDAAAERSIHRSLRELRRLGVRLPARARQNEPTPAATNQPSAAPTGGPAEIDEPG